MKKTIIVLAVIAVFLIFIKIAGFFSPEIEKGFPDESRFETVCVYVIRNLCRGTSHETILRDKHTDIMYVAVYSYMSPLYNADGTVMKYEDWLIEGEINEHN